MRILSRKNSQLMQSLLFAALPFLVSCASSSPHVGYQTTDAFKTYAENPPPNAGAVGLVFAPGMLEQYPLAGMIGAKTFCIDGRKIADVKYEQALGLVLPPGQHQVTWDFDMDMFSGCNPGDNGSYGVVFRVEAGKFHILKTGHPTKNGGTMLVGNEISSAERDWFLRKVMVGTYIHPATLVQSTTASPVTNTTQSATVDTKAAIKECKQLGFKDGTDALLKCVTDLSSGS